MQARRRGGIVPLGTGLVIGFLIARAGIRVESSVEAAGGSGGDRAGGSTSQWATGRASLLDHGVHPERSLEARYRSR